MIVITGASGFIGSCLVSRLNAENYHDLVLVDEFNRDDKLKNIEHLKYTLKVERSKFFNWLDNNHKQVQFIFHLGARTNTAEFDTDLLNRLNLDYSKSIWEACVKYGLPLVYASSAATYGDGSYGYKDDHELCFKLKPLNPYGISKNEFDKWALNQKEKPYFWAGLKFFNVYGPNEYHKGRMASVILHAYRQIKENAYMNLFRSHKDGIADGMQKRDFVYVKDVVNVCYFLMNNRKADKSAIYNLGTGKAESFLQLAESTFEAMELKADIRFIDIPEDIREKYQYYTCADMDKLREAGYTDAFTDLNKGVIDYVRQYLSNAKYF